MKRYFLKQNVTDETLEKYGFEFMDTPAGRAAIYPMQKEIDSLIVILRPPIREIKSRYQKETNDLEETIKSIKELLDERNV
jgi:hypothetical protein